MDRIRKCLLKKNEFFNRDQIESDHFHFKMDQCHNYIKCYKSKIYLVSSCLKF